jgi:hypothetical protein
LLTYPQLVYTIKAMSKQKRMVYVYEENLDFYDSLLNKSEFVNQAISREKRKTEAPNPNLDYIRQKVAEIDAKNAAARG